MESDTEAKIYIYIYTERPTLPKVTLFEFNLLLVKQVCSRHTQMDGTTAKTCSIGNSSNSSDCPYQKPERGLTILFISIKVIVIVTCFSVNFLVIRAFFKFSNLRTPSNLILVSLCIADCLISTTFIFDIIHDHLALRKGSNDKLKCILCEINTHFSLSITIVIVLHLVLISVERFIAVKFSLRYRSILTNRRALLASVALWMWALLVSVVFPKVLHLEENGASMKNIRKALHPCHRAHAFKCLETYVIFLTTSLVISLLITLFCHGYIFTVSSIHRKQIRRQHNLSRGATIKQEFKRARVAFMVVASSLLCFVPLFTFLTLRLTGKLPDDNCHHRRAHHMMRIKRIVYTSAMCLNAICTPIIYGLKNQQFKTALLKMVKCT